jgi:hypothetical protein
MHGGCLTYLRIQGLQIGLYEVRIIIFLSKRLFNGTIVRSVLTALSSPLDNLCAVAQIHTPLVANPLNTSDDGFLGYTTVGREFWRGLRGGWIAGAQEFHRQAIASATAFFLVSDTRSECPEVRMTRKVHTPAKKGPADLLKRNFPLPKEVLLSGGNWTA